MIQTATQSLLPQSSTPSETEIIAYLHRSYQWAEIINAVELEAMILALCQEFGIEITDEEWQTAGDAFRLKHQLLGIQQTQAWLQQQRISLEEWSEGIKNQLLFTKLKEYLFGVQVDGYYLANRDHYRRVALSQILVRDLDQAIAIAQLLREQNASFCALAIEHSLGQQSQTNGGFMGIRYVSELAPEIAQAIKNVEVGVIIGPIQTQVGYHILRIEKWFPLKFNQSARERVLEACWQVWLKEQSS
ncbi:PpiC-type peptidyl-prolyl cis-trans isomerase [Stanieria cyanosphaera PCC 7437]|uniref:peptidylprolyl isomerase n=1 Tax=Stanieria cyanosphaera (strain ATCC 29371 / PCC 7437) TaxID=111780 RepID=K9XUL4_STAC7|nr:peptidylprolyl isomerase [Stanieria cyanosphaera]AFZ35754.1 PpiC-type peptidyl-prolyl cis-trans isomerase [Stanieria cyanosphaera PCC 7437]